VPCSLQRREDLEQLDERNRDLQFQKPSVPAHFALYELPQRTVPDLRDDVSETASEMRRMKRKTLRYMFACYSTGSVVILF
jgi:hypothetical protein